MSEIGITKRQLEEFAQNPVWIEMRETLAIRRSNYLEDLAKATDIEDIRKIQGCIVEMDYQMQQPEFILMEVQDKEEETEPESESGVTE